MTAPTLRLATAADLDDLERLLVAQLVEHDLPTPDTRPAIQGVLDDGTRGALLVAEESGTLVGVAFLQWIWSIEHGGGCAFLDELYVVPSHRERGLGGRLLAAPIALTRAQGRRTVELEITREHARAAHLYERAVFVALDRQRYVKHV